MLMFASRDRVTLATNVGEEFCKSFSVIPSYKCYSMAIYNKAKVYFSFFEQIFVIS